MSKRGGRAPLTIADKLCDKCKRWAIPEPIEDGQYFFADRFWQYIKARFGGATGEAASTLGVSRQYLRQLGGLDAKAGLYGPSMHKYMHILAVETLPIGTWIRARRHPLTAKQVEAQKQSAEAVAGTIPPPGRQKYFSPEKLREYAEERFGSVHAAGETLAEIVHPRTIFGWTNGKNMPPFDTLCRVCAAWAVPLETFMER